MKHVGLQSNSKDIATLGLTTAEATHAAVSKVTPVDADELPLIDSAASWGLKRLTWANLKAALQSLFFHRGNILGTVSQASGVPTGAIVQRGSNANGEFVRFADGTQICTLYAGVAGVTVIADGEHPINTWTYPAAFAVAPTFLAGASGTNSGFFVVRSVNPTTTNVGSLYLINLSSAARGAPPNLHMLAVGRWF